MRKFLAAGAIASVALSSANAECVNGGFYVQGSFGMSMTKMKYKNNLEPQCRLLKKGEVEKMEWFKVISSSEVYNAGSQAQAIANGGMIGAINGCESCVWWRNVDSSYASVDATKTSLQKRKGVFQFELGFGIDKRIGDVMIGIDVNFGKNFGNVKKKVKGLACREYPEIDGLYDSFVPLGNILEYITQDHGRLGALIRVKDRIMNMYTHATNSINELTDESVAVLDDAVKTEKVIATSILLSLPLYDPDFELEFKCKNKFYVSIMPRIGMLLNPRTELYATFGMKIKGDKYTVRAVEENESGSKSVTKCIPSFGLGLRHTFKSGVFVKLEYNMNLKASKTFKKLKIGDTVIDETTKHTLKNSSHDIKLGFGRKF